MVISADTSFLYSLYGNDANSAEARRLASAFKTPITVGPLHLHELRNAFRLAVFRKEIKAAQRQAVLASIEADLSSGVLVETPLSLSEILAAAERLSAAHTEILGTCAMDILHVATAHVAGTRDFYTFDARQASLARAAGLRVKPFKVQTTK